VARDARLQPPAGRHLGRPEDGECRSRRCGAHVALRACTAGDRRRAARVAGRCGVVAADGGARRSAAGDQPAALVRRRHARRRRRRSARRAGARGSARTLSGGADLPGPGTGGSRSRPARCRAVAERTTGRALARADAGDDGPGRGRADARAGSGSSHARAGSGGRHARAASGSPDAHAACACAGGPDADPSGLPAISRRRPARDAAARRRATRSPSPPRGARPPDGAHHPIAETNDGGLNWSINGSNHIGDAGTVEYPIIRRRYSRKLRSEFEFTREAARNDTCAAWSIEIRATAWIGGGDDSIKQRGLDRCIPDALGLGFPSGYGFQRNRDSAVRYTRGVSAFGVSLTTQSGFSESVELHYRFRGPHGKRHWLCGPDGRQSPFESGRVFSGAR
jgi:hypothetical protein